jgi:N6-adenosine-specific RNA methylase IME4
VAGKYRTIVADPPWEIRAFPRHERSVGPPRVPFDTMTVEEIKALPVGEFAAPEAHLYLWTIASYLRDAYVVAEAWGFEPMYPLVWCKAPLGEGLGGKFASNVEFVLFCRERHGAVAITSYLADAAKSLGLTNRDVNRAMGASDMAGWWLSRLPHRSRIPTDEQWGRLKQLLELDDRYDEAVASVNAHRGDGLRCDTRWWLWPRGKHSEKPEAFLDVVEQVSPAPYLELFARRQRLGWDTWGDEALNHVELAS